MKKLMAIVAISGFVFTSCNTNENKEFNVELTDGTSVTYNPQNEDAIAFEDWSEFNAANATLLNLDDRDYEIEITSLESLNGSISNLANSIPSSLKTEEVLEDIDDVQEEYTKLINEKNEPLKNVKQNIEELVEKFDDLREELNETVEDYVS